MPPAVSSLRQNAKVWTKGLFGAEYTSSIDVDDEVSHRERIAAKIRQEYKNVKELPFFLAEKQGKRKPASPPPSSQSTSVQTKLIEDVDRSQRLLHFLDDF
jgi:hypothetical protein